MFTGENDVILCQELQNLLHYSASLEESLKSFLEGKMQWDFPKLAMPSVFALTPCIFDDDDINILYFVVSVTYSRELTNLLRQCFGFSSPTPDAWLQLHAQGNKTLYWSEQYRFLQDRPLFRHGLLQLAAPIKPWGQKNWSTHKNEENECDIPSNSLLTENHSPLHRILCVPEDVLMAFCGERVLQHDIKSLGSTVTRWLPQRPIAFPPFNPAEITMLRRLIRMYHEDLSGSENHDHLLWHTMLSTVVEVFSSGRISMTHCILALCHQLNQAVLLLDAKLLKMQSRRQQAHIIHETVRQAHLYGELLLIEHIQEVWDSEVLMLELLSTLQSYRTLTLLGNSKGEALPENLKAVVQMRLNLEPKITEECEKTAMYMELWSDVINKYSLSPLNAEECANSFPYTANVIEHLGFILNFLKHEEEPSKALVIEALGHLP